MKLPVEFRDDKPVFDWNAPDYGRYRSTGKMKSWRHQPLPKWTASEVSKCVLIGMGLGVFFIAFLVVLFCWL